MAQAVLTDIETTTGELAVRAFEAFCEDVGGMFGVDISCTHEATGNCTSVDLKKTFPKLVASNTVKADGAINGEFRLLFDKKGLFTLAGIVVMLPDERTLHLSKTGDVKDAQDIADAVRETGNLLVGSWDRVFRENMKGHGHFVRGDVFIGDPWTDAKKNAGVEDGETCLCVRCSLTAGPYPPFKCAAVFPAAKPAAAVQEPPKAAAALASSAQPQDANGSEGEPANKESSVSPAIQEVVASAVSNDPAAQPVGGSASGSTMAVQTGNLLVKDILCTDLIWVDEDSTVGSVFEATESRSAGYAIVGKDGSANGIVSRYDIAGALSPYLNPLFSKWRRPQDDATLDIKVKWIMSKPVRMIDAGAGINVAVAKMLQWRVGSLPVTDQSGKIVGIITRQELLKLLLKSN